MEASFAELDVTVNDLLHFTQDRDPQLRTFALRPLVEAGQFAGPQFAAQQISTFIEVAETLEVTADRSMLRRVLLNLVLNALDAMPNGGTDSLGRVWKQGVELKVIDSGPGLSEEAWYHAFEPFFTTKPGGTGLGLAIVHRIAEVRGEKSLGATAPAESHLHRHDSLFGPGGCRMRPNLASSLDA